MMDKDSKTEDLSISSEVEEFAEFFRCVHGYDPFPWQARLMKQVLMRGKWPDVIDLPTGTGKTAVLDVAVFAMSRRPETSPRRIVFVVDRRIVVDQVYKRAQKIQDKIRGGDSGVLARVRERLKECGGGDESLGIAMLRGGIPIDSEWARRPDQPWVMVSTVDQFGSCLLFRGYMASKRMRPIYAGLAGNDCLVILDEVHLSLPFAHTLAHLAKIESSHMPRRFEVVEMSATPSDADAERFGLDRVTDLDGCEELSRRVGVAKPAELVLVTNEKAIPGKVLDILRLIRDKAAAMKSIGVVVNRVATARDTYHALSDTGYDTALVTGRMRPLDKVDALDRINHIVDPDRKEAPDTLSVVVATQAIEVGADFSFDAMITECAAVDSLRQRFGRLDRRGKSPKREGRTRAWIIGPKSTVKSTKKDPIYGDAIQATWKELERRKDASTLDVGPLSMDGFPDEATAPKLCSPLVQKTHLDAWAQTSPEPIIQPSIDWFLHGIGSKYEPDVSIAWRRDRTSEALATVPPRQAECVSVRMSEARSWLEIERKTAGGGAESTNKGSYAGSEPDWVLWRGSDGIDYDPAPGDIRPGDIIIADPVMGGLMSGTWSPSSMDMVDDLGDYAQLQHGGKITLRLDPDLVKGMPPRPSDENLESTPARKRIVQWLEKQNSTTAPKHHNIALSEIIANLGSDFEIIPVGMGSERDKGYYILSKRMVDTTAMQGTDESESQIGTNVSLEAHLKGVGERARDMARRLNLPDSIAEDLYLAGMLHDVGKVDGRFQAQLVGWDPVEMEMQKEPLAKSLPGVRRVTNQPGGYPRGMRHEVASVALLESNKNVLDAANDRDLVMYLVGVHHGWGRPLPPIIRDPKPRMLSYEFRGHKMNSDSDLTAGGLAASMAERFWRLTEEYGHYGLAWLESILRLSDHQQSAEEGKR